jgi:uroporphyrinogen-III synthase
LAPIFTTLTKKSDLQKTAIRGKLIFISRQITDSSPLQKLVTEGHTLHAESLITISKIRFTHTPKTDWIFFSSKNAIKYFFSQEPELAPAVKFAVMGEASRQFLKTYDKEAAFVGKGVDVSAIAKDFASQIGNQTVLLPQAIDSFQSIQKQLSFSNNCFNLFVYKTTVKTDFEIPTADVLVFTSPSNVKAYFAKYQYYPQQIVVGIGSTTAAALRTAGVKQVSLPKSFTEEGLLEILQSLLSEQKADKQ